MNVVEYCLTVISDGFELALIGELRKFLAIFENLQNLPHFWIKTASISPLTLLQTADFANISFILVVLYFRPDDDEIRRSCNIKFRQMVLHIPLFNH